MFKLRTYKLFIPRLLCAFLYQHYRNIIKYTSRLQSPYITITSHKKEKQSIVIVSKPLRGLFHLYCIVKLASWFKQVLVQCRYNQRWSFIIRWQISYNVMFHPLALIYKVCWLTTPVALRRLDAFAISTHQSIGWLVLLHTLALILEKYGTIQQQLNALGVNKYILLTF